LCCGSNFLVPFPIHLLQCSGQSHQIVGQSIKQASRAPGSR
jgi:hypothetical protein